MKLFKRLVVITCLALSIAPAQADMIATGALETAPAPAVILGDPAERAQVVQQLIDGGVEPAVATQRVAAMTDSQVAELNGQMASLPAGAGLSNTNLLLIIIILILLL